LLVVVAACGDPSVVSPQPIPPPIDISQLSLIEESGDLLLTGGPGAAAEATLIEAHNIALVSLSPSLERVQVAADGSFAARFVGGVLGDEVRLQSSRGNSRSPPVDVEPDPASPGAVVEVARIACIELDPPLEAELAATAVGVPATLAVTLRSSCAGAVDMNGTVFRPVFTPPGWSVDGPVAPFELLQGDSFDYTVTFTPTEAGTSLQLLLFKLSTSPTEVDQRPLTLRAEGR
jgi:hypothetical protein